MLPKGKNRFYLESQNQQKLKRITPGERHDMISVPHLLSNKKSFSIVAVVV